MAQRYHPDGIPSGFAYRRISCVCPVRRHKAISVLCSACLCLLLECGMFQLRYGTATLSSTACRVPRCGDITVATHAAVGVRRCPHFAAQRREAFCPDSFDVCLSSDFEAVVLLTVCGSYRPCQCEAGSCAWRKDTRRAEGSQLVLFLCRAQTFRMYSSIHCRD